MLISYEAVPEIKLQPSSAHLFPCFTIKHYTTANHPTSLHIGQTRIAILQISQFEAGLVSREDNQAYSLKVTIAVSGRESNAAPKTS